MGEIFLQETDSNTIVDMVLFARNESVTKLWELNVLAIKDPIEKKITG